MTFTNVLDSQIKFLESKAGSGTPTAFNNACRQEETEVTKFSQNNFSFFTVIYDAFCCFSNSTAEKLFLKASHVHKTRLKADW